MNRCHVVSFSGGKDSAATILKAIEAGVYPLKVAFADTGHEHELTYEYVDYVQNQLGIKIIRVKANFKARIAQKREYIVRKWAEDGVPQSRIDRALELLVPTGNPMLDMCLWKGRMPSTKARFCTDELKVIPLTNQVLIPAVKKYGKVWSWQGVRADESPARANLRRMDTFRGLPGIYNFRPILHWTAEDVFAMHKKYGLEPNPLYKMGMSRVGCMPCVNCRKGELNEISRRFPAEIERVKNWERLASETSKRGSTTWFCFRDPDKTGVDYKTHGIEKAVEWSKTSRGGRQIDWTLSDDDLPVCSSIYGLCE